MEALAWILVGSIGAAIIVLSVGLACFRTSCRPTNAFTQDQEEEWANGNERLIYFQGGEHLTVDDILNASGEVLGKSSYGTVYQARLQAYDCMISLRLLRHGYARGHGEFTSAIQELGLIRHPHLVALQAFYAGPRGEKLLVYKYIPGGSLAELLYNSDRATPGWATLHEIVLGAARGLAHLHTGLPRPVIHGNLKSRNILLDDNYVAHLSDFGLHQLMTLGANYEILEASASQGYKAPELLKMRNANTKTDIYSFGVVLLEILTGINPGVRDSSNQVVDLPTIVKNAVLEERIFELFDLEILGEEFRSPREEEGLLRILQLAMGCCAPFPSIRPDIGEVIRQLEKSRPKSDSPHYDLSPQLT